MTFKQLHFLVIKPGSFGPVLILLGCSPYSPVESCWAVAGKGGASRWVGSRAKKGCMGWIWIWIHTEAMWASGCPGADGGVNSPCPLLPPLQLSCAGWSEQPSSDASGRQMTGAVGVIWEGFKQWPTPISTLLPFPSPSRPGPILIFCTLHSSDSDKSPFQTCLFPFPIPALLSTAGTGSFPLFPAWIPNSLLDLKQ